METVIRGLEILGGFAIGWAAGRRAPAGSTQALWWRASRKLDRVRRHLARVGRSAVWS